MCLTALYDFDFKKEYGWKVFTKLGSDLVAFVCGSKIYLTNSWITDNEDGFIGFTKYKTGNEDGFIGLTKYKMGFHIFTTRKDARLFRAALCYPGERTCIRKVKFDDVVAKGIDVYSSKVIVARKMFING